MKDNLGRVGCAETGSRASTEPQSSQGLGPSGFDPARECSIGVGDGRGQLFVHGSYEAIKRVQELIMRAEMRNVHP